MNIFSRLREFIGYKLSRNHPETTTSAPPTTTDNPTSTPQKIIAWMRKNAILSIVAAAVMLLALAVGATALFKPIGNNDTSSKPANQNPETNEDTHSVSVVEPGDGSGEDEDSSEPAINKPEGHSGTSSEIIGFVGCSNIRDTVQGYQSIGGTRFWTPADNTYAGGTVTKWGTLNGDYWGQFDQMLAKYPTTKTIWWGLCTYSSERESNSSNNAAAKKVLLEIRKKIPGVTIYVSAINDFVSPHTCRLTGEDGPSRMRILAETLVANEGLEAGPALGSIIYYNIDQTTYNPATGYYTNSAGATAENNQTKPDGCHPNPAGEQFLGKYLLDFFGS